jgi:hypothetical protein
MGRTAKGVRGCTITLLGLAGCHLIFQYPRVATDAQGQVADANAVDSAARDLDELGPVPDLGPADAPPDVHVDAPPDLGSPDHPADSVVPDTQVTADTKPMKHDMGPKDANPIPCSQWSYWNVLICDPATCKATCFPIGHDPVELNCTSSTGCKCTNLNTTQSVSCNVPSANACMACQNAVLVNCCLPLL